ncbi:MAG: NosD domain-containing protein [Halorhabdus sp.]
MRVTVVFTGLIVLVGILSLAFFTPPAETATATPVPFADTLSTGMTDVDVQQARARGVEIPRLEVFYSQYQYVVGYYGFDAALAALGRGATTRQFGRPLAVYVTDFADAGVELTADNALVVSSEPQVDWVAASDAFFVVGSAARTPGGPAIVPFDDRAAASAFANRYGGTIRQWAAVRAMAPHSSTDRASERIAARRAWANETVAERTSLLQRPVSVVVGESVPTLSAAVRAAEPNTTIRLPPGTYRGNLTVEKPVTIQGSDGTRIVGGGNGTVVRMRADRSALLDVSIAGVGAINTGTPSETAVTNGSWDEKIRTVYGYGDAAVVFDGANRSLIDGVAIETPANGVIVRESDGTVIRDSTVTGTRDWRDGFMSVLAMNTRIVVQNSTFVGGRDAVYTHHADGTVVRNNHMTGMRFGVHEMFTSRTLLSHNTVAETNIGIVVMTRPRSNAVVGNRVTDSEVGISVSGSASIVRQNVVRNNRYGIDIGTQRSVVARNLVRDNAVGLRTGTIVPTNIVTANSIVGNDRYVATGRGPIRVWTGNYWGAVPGRDADSDGTIERAFRPSGVVDGAVSDSRAATILARSPAVALRRQLQTAVPGLRTAGVIDDEPLARPPVALHANTTPREVASR